MEDNRERYVILGASGALEFETDVQICDECGEGQEVKGQGLFECEHCGSLQETD